MSSNLQTLSQHLSLGNVHALVLTEIVSANGIFTRAVRFYGDPLVSGAPSLILDVTLGAVDKANLEVSTPVLQF